MDIIKQAWNHFDTISRLATNGSPFLKKECQLWMELVKPHISATFSSSFDKNLRPIHGTGCLSHSYGAWKETGIPSMDIQLCSMVNYTNCGSQNVVVGPNMQDAFTNTELGKVSGMDLDFPFPTYWISIPDNEDIKIFGGDSKSFISSIEVEGGSIKVWGTGWHRVQGAYVVIHEDGMLVHMWGPNPEDQTVSQHINSLTNGPPELNLKGNVGLDWAHQWFSIKFTPDQDLEKTIQNIYSDNSTEVKDPHPDNPANDYWDESLLAMTKTGEGQNIMIESAKKMLRIIINSALYMTSPKNSIEYVRNETKDRLLKEAEELIKEADVNKSQRKRTKLEKKAARKREKAKRYSSPVIWIGADIERKMFSENKGEGITPRGHVRKGHWHKYLIGPRIDQDRNSIPSEDRAFIHHWIPPIWCADRDNPNQGKTYAFEDGA